MHTPNDDPIVAFMLAHYPRRASWHAMAHLALDRLPLATTEGLRFWRLLGVGQGRAFDPHADLQRYAMFTVWDSVTALKRFEQSSRVMRRIRQRTDEIWSVHMRPVRWHGRWSGREPFAGIPLVPPPQPGPWIILTRATLRLTKIAAFLQAVPVVSTHLLQQPDLLQSVGVGEAPLLYQATFSVWRTLPAITTFAYDGTSPHIEVIRRTRREGWYREELFARFRPIDTWGTWDGVNPLAEFLPLS